MNKTVFKLVANMIVLNISISLSAITENNLKINVNSKILIELQYIYVYLRKSVSLFSILCYPVIWHQFIIHTFIMCMMAFIKNDQGENIYWHFSCCCFYQVVAQGFRCQKYQSGFGHFRFKVFTVVFISFPYFDFTLKKRKNYKYQSIVKVRKIV